MVALGNRHDAVDPFRHLRHRIARRENRKCRDDLKTVSAWGLVGLCCLLGCCDDWRHIHVLQNGNVRERTAGSDRHCQAYGRRLIWNVGS